MANRGLQPMFTNGKCTPGSRFDNLLFKSLKISLIITRQQPKATIDFACSLWIYVFEKLDWGCPSHSVAELSRGADEGKCRGCNTCSEGTKRRTWIGKDMRKNNNVINKTYKDTATYIKRGAIICRKGIFTHRVCICMRIMAGNSNVD